MGLIKTKVEVNDAAIRRVKARMIKLGNKAKPHVGTVGVHAEEGAAKAKNYEGKATDTDLLVVAFAQEYGIGVPERSFLRTWVDQNADRLKAEMTEAMRASFRGSGEEHSDDSVIKNLIAKFAGELRAWVVGNRAGLKGLEAATKKAREKAGISPDQPLFATSQLVAAIKGVLDGKKVD